MVLWAGFLLSFWVATALETHSKFDSLLIRDGVTPRIELVFEIDSGNDKTSHNHTEKSCKHGDSDKKHINKERRSEEPKVKFVPSNEKEHYHNYTRQKIPPLKGSRRLANNDEAEMVTPEIIQKYDYPVEAYTVVTSDGYVLGVHRIPHGRNGYRQCRRRPVVFLMHDVISSSSDWIIQGPERSLGYLLADAGYDVWMGNVRGNRYSRNHVSKSPVSAPFWDFTFDQYGRHDLPAMIDFALTMTEQDQLYYIGHSQGSVQFFLMCSLKPEYNMKIRAAFLLSPVLYLTHMYSPILKFFVYFVNFIGIFFDVIGVHEFLPNSKLMAYFGQIMCKDQDLVQVFCTSVLFLLSGYNRNNLNLTQLPVYMGHTPSGASTKTFIHYGQTSFSGVFREFDLGAVENLAEYNSFKSPPYPLKNVQAPAILFWGRNDWFAHEMDVNRLVSELNNVQLIEVPDPLFSHIDFIFGINAKEMVYDQLMDIMKYY